MAKSKASVRGGKRSRLSPAAAKALPYPDFPLSPHLPSDRWYKTVRGKRVYLGALADWQGALARWEAERDTTCAAWRRRPTLRG